MYGRYAAMPFVLSPRVGTLSVATRAVKREVEAKGWLWAHLSKNGEQVATHTVF